MTVGLLKQLSRACQVCCFHISARDEWAPLAPSPRGYRPCVLTLKMGSLYAKKPIPKLRSAGAEPHDNKGYFFCSEARGKFKAGAEARGISDD